jgi:hypothetical protein
LYVFDPAIPSPAHRSTFLISFREKWCTSLPETKWNSQSESTHRQYLHTKKWHSSYRVHNDGNAQSRCQQANFQ